MATFVSLLNFTDQGIRNVKESPKRYEAFRAMADKVGVDVKGIYYTVGQHDIVAILEGNDDAVTTALLALGSQGNVRSTTLRAWSVEETKKIIGKMP